MTRRSRPDNRHTAHRKQGRNEALKAQVTIDRDVAIGDTHDRLFGAFVEHLGRCVYGGIFEPGHPEADEKGFRRDVLALVK